ncbi:MAG TPA: hypothetical protein VHX88_18205 [Solirubrobacteraceae bacterium]|nr:hypothetical protein [Solirubrobacteraceae bacterium]
MPSLPVRPELRPTLPDLLAPRWRAASSRQRLGVLVAIAVVVIVLLSGTLTVLDPHISEGSPVPYHFRYRNLWKVPTRPGEQVRLQSPRVGPPRELVVMTPVRLPPYRGLVSGELPLYAEAYERMLARTDPGYDLYGEGETHIANGVYGYGVEYWLTVDGRQMVARDLFLMPDHDGVRRGVLMASEQAPTTAVVDPGDVGSAGSLSLPVKTFGF